jgi:hypothetical protein
MNTGKTDLNLGKIIAASGADVQYGNGFAQLVREAKEPERREYHLYHL